MILIWSGYDTNIHVASNAFALMGVGLPPVVIRHSNGPAALVRDVCNVQK